MKRIASVVLVAILFLALPSSPVHVSATRDDFRNLEFFLERTLNKAENSIERNEIINRFLFKALALVYEQNQEQIRLDRDALKVLKELRDAQIKEVRELERYLSRR